MTEADVLMKVNVPGRCSLEAHKKTLAGIASNHRGSEHPQRNQQAEREGQTGIHLSRPVILIAYTVHQQGTSWDQTG